jgi:hypothetical protein
MAEFWLAIAGVLLGGAIGGIIAFLVQMPLVS